MSTILTKRKEHKDGVEVLSMRTLRADRYDRKGYGCSVVCCGEEMKELIPGTTDASVEKHVPVYEVKGNKVFVTVGSVEHPMVPEHYIDGSLYRLSSESSAKN